jgi:hypothetical protein
VVAEDLTAERDQHDPGEVKEVESDQAPVKAGHVAEEAVVDDPEATDHREAEPVGEEVLALVPQDRPEVVVADVLGHAEIEHQQRDRDREDPVAEGDDARELDLVFLPLLGRLRSRHGPIIEFGRDGTAPCPSAPTMVPSRRRSSVGRALHS